MHPTIRSLFFLALFSAMAVVVRAAVPNIEKDLWLYLPMNEGSGKKVKDLGPNGFDTEMSDPAPDWVDAKDHPKIDKALQFDGKSTFVMIDMNSQGNDIDSHVDENAGLSICAWVKVIKTGTDNHGQGRQPIVMKGAGGGWEFALYVYDNLAPGMSVWNCGGSGVAEPSGGFLGTDWQYQCGTFNVKDGAQVFLNADPDPVAEAPSNANVPCDGSRPVFIAHREDGQWLNAVIAEVRMWSRVISADEMELAMNAIGGLSVDPEGKMATVWGSIKERR